MSISKLHQSIVIILCDSLCRVKTDRARGKILSVNLRAISDFKPCQKGKQLI